MTNLKIFSGRSHQALSNAISKSIDVKLGKCEIVNFADGETWVKYNSNIRGDDVYIIQSTNPPAENLLELLMMIDAAKRASAKKIAVVIPYFGYGRQDRKDQPRVAITAKLIANLITTAGANRVITMDLHAPQIQGFFDIPVDHLYASAVFMPFLRKLDIPNLAVVSPDVGSIKLARSYAKRLNADLVLIDKRRPKPNVAEVMNIIGDVKDKNVLIVDDLIDTAGTFTNAVESLKKNGAKDVYGACSHSVFSGDAIERIENSYVKKLFVTDTYPSQKESKKIEYISVAEIFGEAILRCYNNESITTLFDVEKN